MEDSVNSHDDELTNECCSKTLPFSIVEPKVCLDDRSSEFNSVIVEDEDSKIIRLSLSTKSYLQLLSSLITTSSDRLNESSSYDDHDVNNEDTQDSITTTLLHTRLEQLQNKNPLYIRIIKPYLFQYTSHVKRRWIGRTIYDVYSTEFGSYPTTYYKMAIVQGRIRVCDTIVDCSYIVQENDILSHTIHRHEPAVSISSSIETNTYDRYSSTTTNPTIISIVGETDELVAVDKPSTMPVYQCGSYFKNSVVSIMENTIRQNAIPRQSLEGTTDIIKEDDVYGKLHTIHRLDRLTSGLLLLGKTPQAAKEWGIAIQKEECRTVEKLYLARVRGRFLSTIAHDNGDNVVVIQNPSSDVDSKRNDNTSHPTTSSSSEKLPNHDECLRMNGGNIPIRGQWIRSTSNNVRTNNNGNKSDLINDMTIEEKLTIARRKNALGYWITDHNGTVLEDTSLTTFATTEHTIDLWLQVLEQARNKSNSTPNNVSLSLQCDRIIDTSTGSTPYLWFHFVCPVRLVDAKTTTCTAQSFHELDDITYVQTVKPAHTSFAIIKYNIDDDTTVLLVRPHTGRTHQIRIHLQYLCHPIANDPKYGGTIWFGNENGEMVCKMADKLLTILGTSNNTNDPFHCSSNDHHHDSKKECSSSVLNLSNDGKEQQEQEQQQQPRPLEQQMSNNETLDEYVTRTCVWCLRIKSLQKHLCTTTVSEDDRAVIEYFVHSPGLWLHALQYTLNGNTFQTKVPAWCSRS